MKTNIKIFFLFILLISGYIEAQNFCNTITTQGNIAAYWGDTASNRYANTPQSSILSPYYSSTNISNVTYGSGTNGSALNGTTLNGGTAVSYYNISGVVSTPNGSKYSSFSITTAANAPLMKVQNYYVAALAAVNQNNLNFSARLIVVDPDTGSDVQLAADKAITSSDPNILTNITYLMRPSKTYQFKLYVWNTNGQTNVYMDNPNFYVAPIPNVNPPSSLCLSNVSGTVTSAFASYVVSATPSGMELRWLNSSSVVSGSSPIAADTYTPYYYNTASLCYYPAGSNITVTANPSSVSVTPATQMVVTNATPANLTVTANGATSYQWYSNATNSSTGGTLISGATSSIYTTPTSTVGTTYYYVVARGVGGCGTASSTAEVIVNACPAGNTAPPVNTFVAAACPAGTANLNTQAHTGTIPANSTLLWFTDVAHTTAVSNPTAVGAGSYYAFYYNSTNNCYSPASAMVNVVVFVCAPCTPSDPQSANLSLWFSVAAAPSGSTIQWHTASTPSASTLLSSPTVSVTSTPTSYWVFYYNTSTSCYSPGSRVITVSNACCNYPTVDLTNVQNPTAPEGFTKVWYTTKNRANGTLVSNPRAVGDGIYWLYFFNSSTNTYTLAGDPVLVAIDSECSAACYKPGLSTGGTVLDTKVGISALGRAGADDADNWPMTRKGGHIALESKTKAFVPNRVAFSDADNNVATPYVPIGIAAANFVEGMMVYDTTNKCLKIYTLKDGDAAMAWHCVTTQACPD